MRAPSAVDQSIPATNTSGIPARSPKDLSPDHQATSGTDLTARPRRESKVVGRRKAQGRSRDGSQYSLNEYLSAATAHQTSPLVFARRILCESPKGEGPDPGVRRVFVSRMLPLCLWGCDVKDQVGGMRAENAAPGIYALWGHVWRAYGVAESGVVSWPGAGWVSGTGR